MKRTLKLGVTLGVLGVMTNTAAAQTATPVGDMLSGIDTTTIASEVGVWGAAAVGVFLAIAAIPLAKRLLSAVMGR